MPAPPQPPPRGLSLYADLLDPSTESPATISSAPVLYSEAAGQQSARKPVDPALRFQPIRRPQVKQKPKPTFPKTIPGSAPPKPFSSAPDPAAAPTAPGGVQPPAPASAPAAKNTLADWAAREEDEWRYSAAAAEKRQRGGRRNKKKNRGGGQAETDWDELYDPSRPTNVEEYLRSDERIREVREWKDLLYRRRNKDRRGSDEEEVEDEDEGERPSMSNRFAPPPSYSFAPPPPSPPRAAVPDDPTGDDAYARRLRISQGSAPPPPPPPPPPPKEDQGAVISAAPVRYSPPPAALGTGEEEEEEEEDYRPALGSAAAPPPDSEQQRSSNRPGQEGFAHRLMSKYGWTKGAALGSSEKGISTPLRVHVEKRKRRPDAEGGGWAEPAPRTRILGGERKGGGADDGAGAMSEVIVLRNMLEGMEDLGGEVEAGLGQEIGEECGDKYGRVERLYIDIESRQVFIKFTNQVSALRAVSELKGRIFNGNAIEAKFFDVDKFESGVYR